MYGGNSDMTHVPSNLFEIKHNLYHALSILFEQVMLGLEKSWRNSCHVIVALPQGNLSLGFQTKQDKNKAPQLQRLARRLKFAWVKLRYGAFQKANNKEADQTARMCRLVSTFVVCKPPKTGLFATRLIYNLSWYKLYSWHNTCHMLYVICPDKNCYNSVCAVYDICTLYQFCEMCAYDQKYMGDSHFCRLILNNEFMHWVAAYCVFMVNFSQLTWAQHAQGKFGQNFFISCFTGTFFSDLGPREWKKLKKKVLKMTS